YRKSHELQAQGSHLRELNAELERQSQYVRGLIESSLDPLITIDKEGTITDMNNALTEITGRRRDEIRGTFFFDYFTKPELAREVHREVFDRGSITDFQLTMRHKNGRLTDVLFNGSVYRDDKGEV